MLQYFTQRTEQSRMSGCGEIRHETANQFLAEGKILHSILSQPTKIGDNSLILESNFSGAVLAQYEVDIE